MLRGEGNVGFAFPIFKRYTPRAEAGTNDKSYSIIIIRRRSGRGSQVMVVYGPDSKVFAQTTWHRETYHAVENLDRESRQLADHAMKIVERRWRRNRA